MIKIKITSLSRAIYRAIVIGLLILLFDPSAIWALPFSVIIGLLTEFKTFTEK